MIRVNLLPTQKTRRRDGRRAAPVAMPSGGGSGEGPNSLVLGLLVCVVALAGMYFWYYRLNQETEKLEKQLQEAKVENQRLSLVKARYEESKRKYDLFKRRVDVIDRLKDEQKDPTIILNLVADTVNKTDAVWLEAMTNDGKSIDFTGKALNPNAVADLMTNLRKTGAFKNVEIKETSQDPQTKDIQTFRFELVCEIGKLDKKTT
jgi:Tfp pilus assembly protein PilN